MELMRTLKDSREALRSRLSIQRYRNESGHLLIFGRPVRLAQLTL
jgi:hypothetical protein